MDKEYQDVPAGEPNEEKSGKPLIAIVLLWARRSLLLLLSVFLFIFLIFQLPFVQTALVKKVAGNLSTVLNTQVSIDYISLLFFDKFTLQGVYIEDFQCDTLLYSRQLKADINLNPIVLLQRGIEVEEVSLWDSRIYLQRDEAFAKSNIQQVIEQLSSPVDSVQKKPSRPLHFKLRRLFLENVLFRNEDRLKGNLQEFWVGEGAIYIDRLDLPHKRIDVKTIELLESKIRIESRQESPMLATLLPETAPESTSAEIEAAGQDSSGLVFTIDRFLMGEGEFILHNYRKAPVKLTAEDELDYKHLELKNIEIDIRDFSFSDLNFRGKVEKIAGITSSGFVLNQLAAEEALVSPQRVELNGLKIITPDSELGDTLTFKYSAFTDFEEFPDRVLMDVRLNRASVIIRDILVFVPGLRSNPFFRSNQGELLRLDGRVSGKINNLRGRDLNIELADGSSIVGNFSSRNLAIKNEEILNLRLERLKTSMRTLRQIIPKFNPPPNFDKLGSLDFNGYFDGFFVDFVAYGDLRTDLGRAEMDMRMNLKGGREKANYSGNIKLENFDLGRWSDNPNFGIVTFNSRVIDGVGLTGESANAILFANIESFQFKGYNYQNAQLEGQLQWNHFDGNFSIEDENIDFAFQGDINLSDDGVPTYQFNASVNKLDLKDLNLSEKDLILSGDLELNLRNRHLADLAGTARIFDFEILHNQEEAYRIDSILITNEFDSLGNKDFEVHSDILNAQIAGRFDLAQIPQAIIRNFARNYPVFSDRLGLKPSEAVLDSIINFNYSLELKDSKGLNRLINPQLGGIQHTFLKGHFDNVDDYLKADLELPGLQFGKLEFQDIVVIMETRGDQGDLDMAVDSTIINGKTGFSPVTLLSIFDRDTLNFGINYSASARSVLDNLNLNGRLFVLDSTHFQIEFDRSDLVILESTWDINERNYVRFGQKSIETSNFNLTRGDRRITLESYGQQGLKLSLVNLDFSYIDEIWDYDPLDFAGRYNVYAVVKDVFQLSDISATAVADTLYVNDDDWGRLRFDAQAQDLKHPISAYLNITKDTAQLTAEGTFNPSNAEGEELLESQQVNYFDFRLDISGYSLGIAEYFIGDVISDTRGSFDANLRLNGLPALPNIGGTMQIREGAVTVNYLKTRYFFKQADVAVNNTLFDVSGTVLKDRYGHEATLFGGIKHDHLKDLGFSARLSAERFLALDTKKGDNNLFYGHALGTGEIWFSGSFKQPDIYINATVGDSTELVIPVSSGADASQLSFVRFVEKYAPAENQAPVNSADLRGVDLEMDLRVTDPAVVKIVFNEQAGDIIQGSGRGNIRILVPRGGDFQMFGDYVIAKGDYLFTLYNVVNKNFAIRNGGTIQWSGDPFGAVINLEAEYKNLQAPVSNFIAEYLTNADPSVKNEASNGTDVNLRMILQGDLLKPIINFDISFPNLRGQLQSYTESKLRLLKQDQNELNKQVFGLIVAGQFIPSDISTFQGSEIIYNTVSEFISNQLSLLLTELFSEFIDDGTVLSGIDFDIAYNQYQSVDLGEGQNINRGDELQVSLRQNFFNDRLSILVGGNFGIGTNTVPTAAGTSGAFVGNDIIIEYVLNKDRSLKLRVYQLLEPDVGGGRRLEIGTGLSFRREFDSFSDFLRSLKYIFRKKENEAN